MRLPRVRFTVRWMMLAVAVSAVLTVAEKARRTRAYRLEQAEVYAHSLATWRPTAADLRSHIDDLRADVRNGGPPGELAGGAETVSGI